MPWSEAVILYRQLLKDANKFPAYMYRTYAMRRIRDGFRQNQHIKDPQEVSKLMTAARESLGVIQRQVVIGRMYSTNQSTIVEVLNRK